MDTGKAETGGRKDLSNLFRRLEACLVDSEPGLPRFLEFANLVFLKLMEERQKGDLWKALKAAPDKIGYINNVAIPQLHAEFKAQDAFSLIKLTAESPLNRIINLLDKHQLASFDLDILGVGFEYFLRNSLALKQSLGQYFTPRPVARVMAGLAALKLDDTVYDPFCGAGGLLVEAFNHFGEEGKRVQFFGRDASASTRVAKMNAILHWGDHSGIVQVANTLRYPVHGKYSVGLTNVPFARDPRNYAYDNLYENGLARKKTDALSILHLFQSLKTGGRMAAIVPEGFLVGSERAGVRGFLMDNANLRLVASLPSSTFLPYAHVKTAIIYLDNLHCPVPQKDFWYLDADRSGMDALNRFHGAAEDDLIKLGYIKIPLEKIQGNQESWLGKQYEEAKKSYSAYPLVPLGDLVAFSPTGFSPKKVGLSEEGIPFFTLKSIKQGFLSPCETRFLREGTQTDEKSLCVEGDILVALKDKNREAAILGRATIASRKGVFSSDLTKVKVKDGALLSKDYLYYLFRNENYLNEVKRFSAGSIVRGISLELMAGIRIPLPPLSVQEETVKEFRQYEQVIAAQDETRNFLHQQCQERLKSLWL